jgi:putative cell wall-binding protein
MNHPITRTGVLSNMAAVIGLGGTLLMTACASNPIDPTVAISAATQAIATADTARIADSASPELNEAREKLTAAQNAAREEDMEIAQRLAIESRVDAELATAKAQTAKEKAVNDEIKRSTETLASEMRRTSGVK